MKLIRIISILTILLGTIGYAGDLSVSVTPVMGARSHSHVVAIWIEDEAGRFVKTVALWGRQFAWELTTWAAASSQDTTDATTSATLAVYDTTLSGLWNLNNKSGVRVPNGSYWYCVEMANWGNPLNPFVKTRIAIDGISKTKSTVDTSINEGSTYLTGLIGKYTDANTRNAHPTTSVASLQQKAVPKKPVMMNGKIVPASPEKQSFHGTAHRIQK